LIIFHDKTLKRLADRDDNIEELTSSSIRQIDLQGSHLPTLEELLDLVQDKLLLNLEIKTVRYRSSVVEKKLLATLRAFGLGSSILVSAFHPLPLYRLSHLAPELKRGYLCWNRYLRTRHRLLVEKKVGPSSLNIALEDATQKTVRSGQARGRRIFVWTVNEPDDMNRMVSWGVDGVFSDRPDRLLSLRTNG
ncbi:MAG: hypothetical protein HYW02_00735, partial [Deltaproteobacteria bacterium]|nr:hypothetical protein [Deltaproteobacteria bacterium]